jgi:hypothetical protein
LLRDLLRSHPGVTIAPESHFIPRFYRAYGDPSSDEEAWRIARSILKTPRVALWQITAQPPDFVGCRSFSEVTSRLFQIWARKEGKPRWGDKTPHYVRDIPLLLRLFPDAQVIHVIRDGRDVALSWLRTQFEPRNLYMAARMWKEMVTRGRREGALSPDRSYMELRYETLLAQPEATMRGVCQFLNEHWNSAVLSPSRLDVMLGKKNRAITSVALHGDIVLDNAGKWRDGMALRQRTLFESVAGDLLSELDYPVEGLARPLSRGTEILLETDHRLRFLASNLWKLRRPRRRRIAISRAGTMLRRLLRHSATSAESQDDART